MVVGRLLPEMCRGQLAISVPAAFNLAKNELRKVKRLKRRLYLLYSQSSGSIFRSVLILTVETVLITSVATNRVIQPVS